MMRHMEVLKMSLILVVSFLSGDGFPFDIRGCQIPDEPR